MNSGKTVLIGLLSLGLGVVVVFSSIYFGLPSLYSLALGVVVAAIIFWPLTGENEEDEDGKIITKLKGAIRNKAVVVVAIIVISIVGLCAISMVMDNNQLEALRNSYKFREEKLEEVYTLENGQEVPRDLVNYSWDAPSPILPGDALSEEEFLPMKVRSESVLFVKGEIVGGAWQDNCGHPPVVKLSSYAPYGTKQTPGDYIIFTGNKGKFAATAKLNFGGKPGLTAGCPTSTGWIKLDYEINKSQQL